MPGPSLTLEYIATDADLSTFTAKGKGYSNHPSHFLASGPGQLIHGNSIIKVMQNGEDCSSAWPTWRYMRIWEMSPTSDLKAFSGKVAFNWHDDNLSKIPNWLDCPGCLNIAPLAGGAGQCFLLEFVAAVLNKPDAGALYFYVIVRGNTAQYRVQMSNAKSIAFAKWPEIKGAPRPWVGAADCAIAVDSNWLALAA